MPETQEAYQTSMVEPTHVPAAPIAVSTPVAVTSTGEEAVVRHRIQSNRLTPAQDRMEDTFQIPIVATLVFVITMIAIFYLGRIVVGYYEPVIVDGQVELVGRRS